MTERWLPHYCHARGCEKRVPPRLFACGKHWHMLPSAIRSRIWAAYEPGQEDRLDPSEEYMQAAQEAIDWLAAAERR